jgi:nucleotide-binding universal stress UspA family protein
MKKILVTTDLSQKSEAAFEMAIEMARAFETSIDLLAIIEDPAQAAMMYALDFPVLPGPDVREQLRKKVEKDLTGVKERAFSGLDCTLHVCEAENPVHEEIVNFVKANDIGLVVLSTHGRSGLTRILIGSVAEKVVRHCPCPVLTIPTKGK